MFNSTAITNKIILHKVGMVNSWIDWWWISVQNMWFRVSIELEDFVSVK